MGSRDISQAPKHQLHLGAVKKARDEVLLLDPRQSWSHGGGCLAGAVVMGECGHCQNCRERGQEEEQGRNSLSSLNSDPPIFFTLSLPSLDRIQKAKELITWLYSGQEGIRESLSWALLEKFGFFDKQGQAWMAVSLILSFPPCLKEDMMARGQQLSCNHEATGISESSYFHLIQVLHDINIPFIDLVYSWSEDT